MAHSDKISEAKAVVEAEREAVRVSKQEVADIEAQLFDAKRKLSEKTASLAIAERMFSIFGAKDTDSPDSVKDSPKRRMRLGAKKRAIYMLVSKQVSTIEQIETHLTVLHSTDIDRRYIRDVVRDALENGDMQGDIDHQFIFTDSGREILEKASIPAGWENYKDAAEMRPATTELPSAATTQVVPASLPRMPGMPAPSGHSMRQVELDDDAEVVKRSSFPGEDLI